jgi:hypothetical protein
MRQKGFLLKSLFNSLEVQGKGHTRSSGKAIEVLFLSGEDEYWPGGNLEEFGPARIEMSKLASLEISRTSK